MRQVALLTMAVAILALPATASRASVDAGPTRSQPGPGDSIGPRSAQFVKKMRVCQKSIRQLRAALGGLDLLQLADLTENLRTICGGVYIQLATHNTRHFRDQALTGSVGIDKLKNGLKHLANWIDDQRPSELIKTRNDFNDGDAYCNQAVREINVRRAKYGVKPIPPLK